MNLSKKTLILIGLLIISLSCFLIIEETNKRENSSIKEKLCNNSIDLTDEVLGEEILKRAQVIFKEKLGKESIKIQDINALNFYAETLAKKLAESKSFLYSLDKKVHVTVVIPIYKEINRMKSRNEHPNGEDFIRQKIKQLHWFSDCPNFSWDLKIIDDGCPLKSGEYAKKIIKLYSEYTNKIWPVSVQFLEDCIKLNKMNTSICPANKTISSTKDSKKGGAVYFGLWKAIKYNIFKPKGSEHIVLYTDADLSAHLGNVGFSVNQIINKGFQVSIGSRKLNPSLTQKSNSNAGKLWYYFWKNFFPSLSVTDTQVGFKAFKSSFLEKIINKPMIEHGLCFDMEILVLANLKNPNSIVEFPLLWVDSVSESTIRKNKDKNFLEMLHSLSRLYQKYGKKNVWKDSFKNLIASLCVNDLNSILDHCPQDICSKTLPELLKYREITAEQLYKRIPEKF